MGLSFQEAVQKIVTDYTIDVLSDTRRFCAMLGDLAPQQQNECRTVKFVFEFGLGKDIIATQALPVSERTLGRARIEKKLIEDIGLSGDRVLFLLENLFDPLAWIGVSDNIYATYQKANIGDVYAEYEYANILLEGKETTRNAVEAIRWFSSAADKGFVEAQHKLGVLYSLGIGIEKDYTKAYIYTEKAANQNSVKSIYNLAIMLANGIGTDVNEKLAVEHLKFAATHGFSLAMNKLGWFYEHGIGIAVDEKKAADLYQRSFIKNPNNPSSYTNLAHLYEQGRGVEKDLDKANQLRSIALKRSACAETNEIKVLLAQYER